MIYGTATVYWHLIPQIFAEAESDYLREAKALRNSSLLSICSMALRESLAYRTDIGYCIYGTNKRSIMNSSNFKKLSLADPLMPVRYV
jgi:hypothetical protein